MIGRRAVIGLSLLCALLFSAFAAQGASAKGTTAFTCVKKAKAEGAGFSDAHCDKEVTTGATFEHVAIGTTATEFEASNEKTATETTKSTNAVLKGELALAPAELTATKVTASGTITNEEIGGVMQNKGTGITIKYTGITVNKPAKCTAAEPIEVKNATSITREDLGAGKNEKGIEFKPEVKEGKTEPFTKITFEGAECALKGKTFPVEGTAIGTGARGSTEAITSSGATLVFTKAMTEGTLKLGGKPASLDSTITTKMTGAEGNPITYTTTTP